MQLYEHVCDERECTDIGCANPDIPGAVLLTPAEYEIIDESKLPELVKLLSIGQLTGSPVGGLTFGAHVPEIKNRGERVSYPSGPTWQVSSIHVSLSACAWATPLSGGQTLAIASLGTFV